MSIECLTRPLGGSRRKMNRMTSSGSIVRGIGQLALGAVLLTAGIGHLTRARKEFQAQVPSWVPIDPDTVVVGSGIVEIGLGTALVVVWKQPARHRLGALAAAFFVAVFPGNIAQFVEHRDAFGLDTDRKRALRLLGQPGLVALALTATRK
jgi:uncharacterized membrane protein